VSAAGIGPVEARMIEDDVQNDPDASLMRRVDESDEIAPCPEARIDIQKMLDAIAVKRVQMTALLEHGAEPDRCYSELLQIRQLGLDAFERAALPPARPGFRPSIPAPALSVAPVGPRCRAVASIQ